MEQEIPLSQGVSQNSGLRRLELKTLFFFFSFLNIDLLWGRVTGREKGLYTVSGEFLPTPSTCIFRHSVCMNEKPKSSSKTPYHHRSHSSSYFQKFVVETFGGPFTNCLVNGFTFSWVLYWVRFE